MKKIYLFLLLFFTIAANAQDFTTLQSQQLALYNTEVNLNTTLTASNKALQGNVTTLTANNAALTNKLSAQAVAFKKTTDSLGVIIASLRNTPPPVVVTPPSGYDYTKNYRYAYITNAYKFSTVPPGIASKIPASKGGIDMVDAGKANPTLGKSMITKDGLLFLQNQEGTKFDALIKGSPQYNDPADAVYPRETWWIFYKPAFYMFEKYFEDDGYGGDFPNSNGQNVIRLNSDNKPNHILPNSMLNDDQYNIVRYQYSKNSSTDSTNLRVWVNGVEQFNKDRSQLTNFYRKYFLLNVGVDTNNGYEGWAEVFATGLLADPVALNITNELVKEYNIGKPLQLPYASNITLTYDNKGNKTVSYKYNNALGIAEDVNAVQIRWIDWQGKGPAGSVYRPEYNNMKTVPANFQGTVQVTDYDVQQHYFGIPSNFYFSN